MPIDLLRDQPLAPTPNPPRPESWPSDYTRAQASAPAPTAPKAEQRQQRRRGGLGLSRRAAALTLVLFIVVLGAAMGLLREAQIPPRGEAIPDSAESALVAAQLAARPGAESQPVLLVATRADGGVLTAADTRTLAALGATVTPAGLPAVGGPTARLAADGRAAYVMVPVRVGSENADNIATIRDLRGNLETAAPTDLRVLVTGGPAFGADIANAFTGADVRLLLVTVGIVAVLLLLTYRSPVLWLVPLLIVGLADQLAGVATKAVGAASGLTFDAGIVSVLVFGAGTNYALILISRYREELRVVADHRLALASARRATAPAILASNLTVVLCLVTLVLAVVPGTRGLGLAGAAGLLIALAAALTVLPAALALAGRRIFWPFVPRLGQASQNGRSAWGRMGSTVVKRPGVVVAGALALLAVLASGLLGTRVGLSQAGHFRVASDSQRGLAVIEQHFPAGIAAPMTVLTNTPYADQVAAAVRALPGVASVVPAGTVSTGRSALTVVGDSAPGSPAAARLVQGTRAAADGIRDADAIVGGSPAVTVDATAAAERDLRVIAPLVLALTGLVLMVLLRAILGPLVLLAVNVASSLATIGAGAWVGRELVGFPALDAQVPLIAFLFLAALGVDYTIFLVHRAHLEERRHGIREGMARALGHTGAVITSAGIVLAGVFAALGVLPLVVLGQLGLIVGLGVLIDTFVVRALLVPGVIALLGQRARWPRRADVTAGLAAAADSEKSAVTA